MIEKKDIIFKFGKSYTISSNEEYFCCVGGSVNLYNKADGLLKGTIRGLSHPNYSEFLKNERLIIKNTTGHYFIYDLSTLEQIKKFKAIKPSQPQDTKFIVMPDNKYLIDFAYFFPERKLFILDIDSGDCFFPDLGQEKGCSAFYNIEESQIYISTNSYTEVPETFHTTFYSLQYPFGEAKLQLLDIPDFGYINHLDYCDGKFAFERMGKIVIYDIKKNQTEQIDFKQDGYLCHLRWSNNGKYIVLAQSEAIKVFDIERKCCIKTYCVKYGYFADFYDNDTKLLIGTWQNGYLINFND